MTFTDITDQAGIKYSNYTGARGKMYFPEAQVPGCAFFDYNNDGRPDILITNMADFPEVKSGRKHTTMVLYRNDGNCHFTDVTHDAGLDIEMFGQGVAVGDYDNDGWDDVYITCVLEPSRLFRNDHGHFVEVTAKAGVDNQSKWGSSAVWWDYDNDGWLDLLVCNYCKWTPKTDVYCRPHGKSKNYCTPNVYDGEPCRLYHNNKDGTFTDVSEKAGIKNMAGKTWGAALLDYNGDGKLDILLANDMEPTSLYRNNGDGTFTDVALETGIALGPNGVPKAGMGIDAADVDNSGRESIIGTAFSGEGLSFFYNPGTELFEDRSVRAGLSVSSLLFLGWSIFFLDYDLDGYKDIIVANGHLYPDIATYQPEISYAERPLVYHNLGNLTFAEVGKDKGATANPILARGASFADIDGDGDLDVLIAANGGRPRLLRNDGGNKNNWLRVRLVGKKSNRDGIGAKVETDAGGMHQMYRVRSGSGFMSALELIVTIGLGQNSNVDSLKITWPSGQIDNYVNVAVKSLLVATEGQGAASYPGQNLTASPIRYLPTERR